jgi:hypothetical protein
MQQDDLGIVVFLVALAFRAGLNNLQSFSPADETSYLVHTGHAGQPGYLRKLPEYTQDFLDSKPGCTHPFRYSWYLFCALVCGEDVSYRKLAWISTIAGALGVVVGWRLGGWPAGVMVMFSPLNLGMGRRALQDTTLGCLTALGFYAAGTGNGIFLGCVLVLLLFVKEVSVLGFAGYATVYWLSGGRNPSPFVVPVALFGGVSWRLLGLDLQKARALFVRLTRHEADAYAMGFGRGPVHTYLLELGLLSPLLIVFLVRGWVWSPLAVGWLVYVGSWSILKFKNYRFFTGADIVARALAASFFVGSPWLWLLLGASVVWDLWMFRRLFIERGVYDPVVHTVAKALDMVP